MTSQPALQPTTQPFIYLLALSCTLLVSACKDQIGLSGPQAGAQAGTQAGVNTGGAQAGVSLGGTGGEGGMSAACVTSDECPPGTLCDEAVMACRAGCLSSAECSETEACVEGFCEALARCDETTPCAEGSVCGCDGLCVPSVGNPCSGDLQCATSDYCDTCEGQCKPRVAPCGACRESSSCERRGDVCASVGEGSQKSCLRACEGQATCDNLGPGYLCSPVGASGSFCVPESGECSSVAGCQSDADCPSEHFCNERLTCQPGCMGEDTSCPAGQLCQGLRCAPPCEGPESCSAEGAVCEEGRCVIPGGCQSSRDCGEPQTYCDLNTLRCVPGCQVDNDCLNANQECVGGTCRPRGCSRNYQCAFGEVCNVETAECVLAEGRHCEAGCDPNAADTSCGSEGQRCLSLQDEEENPIGDFCFEPCQEEPNTCPQGYSCTTLEDPNAGEIKLCIRRCDVMPISE